MAITVLLDRAGQRQPADHGRHDRADGLLRPGDRQRARHHGDVRPRRGRCRADATLDPSCIPSHCSRWRATRSARRSRRRLAAGLSGAGRPADHGNRRSKRFGEPLAPLTLDTRVTRARVLPHPLLHQCTQPVRDRGRPGSRCFDRLARSPGVGLAYSIGCRFLEDP